MGQFLFKQSTNLKDLNKDSIIPESDYSIMGPDGMFHQFEYQDETKGVSKYEVNTGTWKIVKTMAGYKLEPTSFVKDSILEEFVNTKKIEEVVQCFFSNLHLYAEFGIEIPKRGVLLYGPAGTGKSTAISKCIENYTKDGETAVIVWHSAKMEAYEVKDFISTFEYVGVKKLILVIEDLGGIENENTRIASDQSLLSLLDNQEKTFTIPIMIIATTNFPENFASNLTNRAGRFDDKIEVGYPDGKARQALLKFFAKDYATQEALDYVATNKCDKLPPSQLREAYIRCRIHSKTLIQTLKEMNGEAMMYEKAFSKQRSMGFND
jgi:SpoVK/Ycf46/Vps4 family AAA+-type ATPase